LLSCKRRGHNFLSIVAFSVTAQVLI